MILTVDDWTDSTVIAAIVFKNVLLSIGLFIMRVSIFPALPNLFSIHLRLPKFILSRSLLILGSNLLLPLLSALAEAHLFHFLVLLPSSAGFELFGVNFEFGDLLVKVGEVA